MKKTIIIFSSLVSSSLLAGSMGVLKSTNAFNQSAYIKLGAGGSFSSDAKIYANPKF